MASATKTRSFHRLLDASAAPLWVIGPAGQLVFLSRGCALWLGVDVDQLIDRRSVAGSPVSDDPLDRLAAALSPPPGFSERGTAPLKVQPPTIGQHRPEAMEVRFTRVGEGESALTLAVAGSFDDRRIDTEMRDAVALRQLLDAWRKQHQQHASLATAGTSAVVRRLRRRLRVAGSSRSDMTLFGKRGCAAESMAMRIHTLAVPREPIVTVDGALMDPELLDASLMPLIHRLTDSEEASGTALVRGLDEMPDEAQLRLVSLLEAFPQRLRVIALCGPRPAILPAASEKASEHHPPGDPLLIEESQPRGICAELWETICALTIPIPALSERVEDIPMLAAAMLDAIAAAGQTPARRINRAALDALVIYPWPGDFQELQESIGHAARSARSESISREQLPLAVRSYRPDEGPAGRQKRSIDLDETVRRFEMRLIRQAVEAADGNRAEAARRLGISRARLLRKLDDDSAESGQR